MFELLKEVGRGKRGAKDLSYEQAAQAASMFRDGTATPAQMGAFLMAERIKMESPDEITAFIDVYRGTITPLSFPGSIDCAGPYDGRRTSFFATFPTAFVLSACGLPVTLHSSRSLPPKWGMTLSDILSANGIAAEPWQAASERFLQAAAQSGVMYVQTEGSCAALRDIRPLRLEIGIRTMFNTVEKLLRFTDAPYMAVGVYHGTVFEKVAALLLRLGVERGIVVQGMEGSEDVTVAKPTRTLIVENGDFSPFTIDPDSLGLMADVPETEWTAELHWQTADAVLRGESHLAYRNMVLLNSGLRLWVTKHAESLEEGISKARTALEEGLALDKYRQWLSCVK